MKALLATGADVNLQEKVNKPNVLCVDNFACNVDHLFNDAVFHVLIGRRQSTCYPITLIVSLSVDCISLQVIN